MWKHCDDYSGYSLNDCPGVLVKTGDCRFDLFGLKRGEKWIGEPLN